jgi:hypothetical protein
MFIRLSEAFLETIQSVLSLLLQQLPQHMQIVALSEHLLGAKILKSCAVTSPGHMADASKLSQCAWQATF